MSKLIPKINKAISVKNTQIRNSVSLLSVFILLRFIDVF